jgi:glycosyltransferase involved in cell wall biosynthesis
METETVILIIMSTYNGEKYIAEQIESIQSQTYKSWILHIRDDVSSDKTLEIISSYSSKDSRINLIIGKKNLGACKSFFELLKTCNEDYCLFSDQDDVWLPDKIELTLKTMKESEIRYKNKPLLIHSDLIVVNETLKTISNSYWSYHNVKPWRNKPSQILVANTVTGCTMMVNKPLIMLIKPITSQALMHDWWIALIATFFGKIEYIQKPLLLYRQHGDNAVGATKYGWKLYMRRLYSFFLYDFLKGKSTLELSLNQALDFYQQYETELDSYNCGLIKLFLSLPKKTFFKRRIEIFKFKFFRHTLAKNIYLLIKC